MCEQKLVIPKRDRPQDFLYKKSWLQDKQVLVRPNRNRYPRALCAVPGNRSETVKQIFDNEGGILTVKMVTLFGDGYVCAFYARETGGFLWLPTEIRMILPERPLCEAGGTVCKVEDIQDLLNQPGGE